MFGAVRDFQAWRFILAASSPNLSRIVCISEKGYEFRSFSGWIQFYLWFAVTFSGGPLIFLHDGMKLAMFFINFEGIMDSDHPKKSRDAYLPVREK